MHNATLWSFEKSSFLTHVSLMASNDSNARCQIVVGCWEKGIFFFFFEILASGCIFLM